MAQPVNHGMEQTTAAVFAGSGVYTQAVTGTRATLNGGTALMCRSVARVPVMVCV